MGNLGNHPEAAVRQRPKVTCELAGPRRSRRLHGRGFDVARRESGVFVEERLTMGKPLSVTLMALAMGLWVTEHSAEAASYAGGASTRCCPVPQECGGHVEYQ